MNYADLLPTNEDHTFVAGKTRYGKTYLSTHLLLPYVRTSEGTVAPRRFLLAYDAKGTARIAGAVRCSTFRDVFKKANAPEKFPWIVYAPTISELDDRDLIDAFFRLAYERKNNTVYITELSHVCKGAWKGGYPFYLDAILKRGAEFKVPMIGETQEPTNINSALISQTQCVFAFAQKLPAHREKMAEVLPLEYPDGRPDKRGDLLHAKNLPKTKFYFYRDGEPHAVGPYTITLTKKGSAPTIGEGGMTRPSRGVRGKLARLEYPTGPMLS
jgi:hypothetical protein